MKTRKRKCNQSSESESWQGQKPWLAHPHPWRVAQLFRKVRCHLHVKIHDGRLGRERLCKPVRASRLVMSTFTCVPTNPCPLFDFGRDMSITSSLFSSNKGVWPYG